MPKELTPHFEDIQAHYDLSDDFFALLLDPTRTYSCAYFERDDMTLVKFIMTEIFPGGRLPSIEMVHEHATAGGFSCTREQRLRPHYTRTLDLWAQALEAHRDDAIRIQSEEVYERYMKYLTGCAKMFRLGQTDVCQFTLAK